MTFDDGIRDGPTRRWREDGFSIEDDDRDGGPDDEEYRRVLESLRLSGEVAVDDSTTTVSARARDVFEACDEDEKMMTLTIDGVEPRRDEETKSRRDRRYSAHKNNLVQTPS